MKKLFALMAALALCLSLTACGGDQNEDPNDVVGDDWRVTGVVRAEGTITRGRSFRASTSPTGTATATATWRCCSSWTARRC